MVWCEVIEAEPGQVPEGLGKKPGSPRLFGLFCNQCQNIVARNQFVVLIVNLHIPDHYTLRVSVWRCPTLIDFALAG
jgi:hypothetical protein